MQGVAEKDIIQVDFACNDEHGQPMGLAERVNIGELELECTLWKGGVSLRSERGVVYIGRQKYQKYGYKYGVGNWCWDGYWMKESDALRLISYLERQKYWSCTSGPCEQYDKFEQKQPFTLEDLRNCL